MIYEKGPLTVQEQIEQLIQRGMLIPDVALAKQYLANVSYYRLAGYWWPMQANNSTHEFKPGSTFTNVIALYEFDRELRILIFDVIERIEIALRTRLIYHLSHEVDPWWFQNLELFANSGDIVKTLASVNSELSRSRDAFIVEHRDKYKKDTRFPPAWKTLEVVSFGNLSKMYGNLKPGIKAKDLIAAEFGTVNHTFLPSWLQTIAQIRNICAHHGRLWNKNLPGRPKLLPKPPNPWLGHVPPLRDHNKLYIHVCCMGYLLHVISPGNSLSIRMAALLTKYPTVDLNALGFPATWQAEPLWKN